MLLWWNINKQIRLPQNVSTIKFGHMVASITPKESPDKISLVLQ